MQHRIVVKEKGRYNAFPVLNQLPDEAIDDRLYLFAFRGSLRSGRLADVCVQRRRTYLDAIGRSFTAAQLAGYIAAGAVRPALRRFTRRNLDGGGLGGA